jgi:hypothetical protein
VKRRRVPGGQIFCRDEARRIAANNATSEPKNELNNARNGRRAWLCFSAPRDHPKSAGHRLLAELEALDQICGPNQSNL